MILSAGALAFVQKQSYAAIALAVTSLPRSGLTGRTKCAWPSFFVNLAV